MGKFIQQLHLPQHIGAVRPQLVHLKHHYLARRFVGDLKRKRKHKLLLLIHTDC